MKVLKFGGTSVGSIKAIEAVLGIIHDNLQRGEKIAVVFSAMGGFTNHLLEMGSRAARNEEYRDVFKKASDRHLEVINHFIGPRFRSRVIADVMGLFNELEDLLRGITLIREISPRTSDLLVSFGERLSTTLVTEVLKDQGVDCDFLDARKLIKTNASFQQAEVNFELTNHLIQHHFSKNKSLQLITGFIGSTEDGITTTLGRGGSDYTGSIFGSALNASVIEIWTDVPGMMTSDPRKVRNAFTIPVVSYAEAMELTHFGAKVIYPPSLTPAFKANIPIKVLNTFDPSHPGTIVTRQAPPHEYTITGISSIDNLALVNLQGSGMIGVAGVSAKLFTVLARHEISVILISQASSEHSICFAIDPKFSAKVREIMETEFANELRMGDVEGVDIQENLSVIAVVGEGMRQHTGVSGRLFSVLGKNGINIVATAQGSSELNISVVIERKDLSKALNVIHESFFADQVKTLNMFLMGTGLIGKTLLNQLSQQESYMRKFRNLKIRLIGVTNSRVMVIDEGGISKEHWDERMDHDGEKADLSGFIERIKTLNLPNSIFVDCTANKSIVDYYEGLLEASVSIVTPNKTANAASYEEYARRHRMALKKGVKFLYETNVGAGLPVINTIQGLIASGDRFLKIEGVFSGTLSYIFNNFRPGLRFAEVVREAKAKGYTEPDPRDDLSGQDVARKILILAREIGMQLNFEDIEIKPLLPESCQNAPSVDDFFAELENCNAVFEKWVDDADAKGEKLRYVATLESGKITIGLKAVGPNHPLYALEGADNIISFTTKRYHDRPLVIKGPGAGAEVTASGVFADIVSIGSYLS
ncbi:MULTISPECIES: bifunctional aspartate kinase/homoserine dehydrogenase I [unclassified Siphonobacter]|uniref:bifunctional aspartate kinase/homoserine dehydrogenase I n=1 Tax=unclassified Siphonobacter TaxID=2635712 RepID=UPI000CABCE62|nr:MULTISPECIES: bifunctional aspartate kinase/homoserine dehydrogenase I [unclassified Siphonobacter]MDQ1086305.1 aspartokinase/homoserine dehydrogenase 1 [Siphonobacter sp. SORGH_AS_1065]MDR6196585.1 aspartokinase/homoserine dehydrogenase 1 [Siphonobacter sp. SORGH_AS_0500]PKK35795.1 bifunctional aspartate kinase/homoserine dehydrogenase I [Siphonobacter sp. SORGH_AS_0500]